MNLLIILSSVSNFPKLDTPTGIWLEELYVPYTEFAKAGVNVDFVSPKGGKVTIDPLSIEVFKEHILIENFNNNEVFNQKLETTIKLDQVNFEEYEGVFIPGGYAPLFDLYDNPTLDKILKNFISENKIISTICHAGCALLSLEVEDGISFIKDRRVTCFTDAEEKEMNLENDVPFLVETELRKLGGVFESTGNWGECVVVDGKLITGQNPASAYNLSQIILRELGGHKAKR